MGGLALKSSWFKEIAEAVRVDNGQIEAAADSFLQGKEGDNVQRILQALKGIDLTKSRLPQELLEKKTVPENPVGDIEFTIGYLIRYFEKDTGSFAVDISGLDRYIYLILRQFEAAICYGEQTAAEEGRKLLLRVVRKVREQFHHVDERILENYYSACERYLDGCYLYISVLRMSDDMAENIRTGRNSLEKKRLLLEAQRDTLAMGIVHDPELQKNVNAVLTQTYAGQHQIWPKEIRELYDILVQMKISESGMEFQNYLINAQEKQQIYYQQIIENLRNIISSVPVQEDPELLERLDVILEDTYRDAERADDEFARLGSMISHFEERFHSIGMDSVDEGMRELEKRVQKRSESASDPSDVL